MTQDEYRAYIRRAVDRAPAPTPERIARIKTLLAPAVAELHRARTTTRRPQ